MLKALALIATSNTAEEYLTISSTADSPTATTSTATAAAYMYCKAKEILTTALGAVHRQNVV